MPGTDRLIEATKLSEDELDRALKYCKEKEFVHVENINTIGGSKEFWIKGITAGGIDIIEKPEDERGKRPFNLTFNFNNEFNVDSMIKGEAKLF